MLLTDKTEEMKVQLPVGATIDKAKLENYFVFVNSTELVTTLTAKGYSVYLQTADYGVDTFTVYAGIDVGDNIISSIEYENEGSAKDVIIRTNSPIQF